MRYIKIVFEVLLLLILLIIIVIEFRNNRFQEEQIALLKNNLDTLVYELSQKEEMIKNLVSLGNGCDFSGGMLYLEPSYNQRFVEKEVKLLSLPHEKSYVLNIIEPNTLVSINDLVEVKGKRWLYVTIPVYDSPMDYKGWIKESDTTTWYKKEAQSNISLLEGTPYYEASCDNEIINESMKALPYDVYGRIEDKLGNFVLIEAAGGWTFWVEEKYLIYQ